MTWTHLLRALYILVSLAVMVAAQWNPDIGNTRQRLAGATLAGYALATAAAQVYAFSKPLTVATAYIGFGVAWGLLWLSVLLFTRQKVKP